MNHLEPPLFEALFISEVTMEKSWKLADLDQLGSAIAGVCQLPNLPFKVSYWAAKVANQLAPELKLLNETRQQIFAAAGTLSADGQRYEFAEGTIAGVNEKVAALYATEVPLAVFSIKLSDLEQVVGLTGAQLTALMPLIIDNEGAAA